MTREELKQLADLHDENIRLKEQIKKYAYKEQDLIDLVQHLKDYTNESHNILGHDERDASEFVEIFKNSRR